MNRRKFLAALSMGTAHLLACNPLSDLSAKSRFSKDPLQLVKLGKSGLKTTLIGMGTGVNGYNRSAFLTRQDESKSLALLQYAYDRGIRFFDCADSYGTHALMAKALKSFKREEVTLTSKIWLREGGIPEPERQDADVIVDRLCKELNTDYIDLVQFHCMVDDDWTDSQKRQMDIMEDLKEKGKIKAHGVSVHSLPAMKAALKSPWVDVIHCRINPYGIAMDKPEPAEVVEVIHALHNSGKGVIGMKLVGGGKLRNESEKMDKTLRFVLGLGSVDMVIVGFEEIVQVDNYLKRTTNALAEL